MSVPPTSESGTVEEREVVAIRTVDVGGHEHIARLKLADNSEQAADDALLAIQRHEAHYFMAHAVGKVLLGVRPCPDCDMQETLYA